MYSYVYKCSNDEERKFLTSPHEICKKNLKKLFLLDQKRNLNKFQTHKKITLDHFFSQ